jgi:hypothetical protein
MAGLDNKITNIIGTRIPVWVFNQLEERSNKSSSTSRTTNELLYIANKTAWVRLVSSINLSESDMKFFSSAEKGIPVSISNPEDLAKEYILFGGTSKYKKQDNKIIQQLRAGIGPDKAYGILGNEEVKKYGYTPMPGISDASIETQGRLGSVRSATINFKCWDKDQLDIIDALYFKLGFTMLLEWGHTTYFKAGDDKLYHSEDYFIDPFAENVTKERILEQIAKNNRNSEGNYDAMLGLVTNFNFTYNQSGGFDCTIKLMSLGVLGDTIKINNAGLLPGLLKEELKLYTDTLVRIEKAKLAAAKAAEEAAARRILSQVQQGINNTGGVNDAGVQTPPPATFDNYLKEAETKKTIQGKYYQSNKTKTDANANLLISLQTDKAGTSFTNVLALRDLKAFLYFDDSQFKTTIKTTKDRFFGITPNFENYILNQKNWNDIFVPFGANRNYIIFNYVSSVNKLNYTIKIEYAGASPEQKYLDEKQIVSITSYKEDPTFSLTEIVNKLKSVFSNPDNLYAFSRANSFRVGYDGITDPAIGSFKVNLGFEKDVTVDYLGKGLTGNTPFEDKSLKIKFILPITIEFNDSYLITDVKTDDTVKQPDDYVNKQKTIVAQNQTQNQPPPPPADPSLTPEQIDQAIASQSFLELALKSIQLKTLNSAIGKNAISLDVNNTYELKLFETQNLGFLEQIFSNGIFSGIIKELSDQKKLTDPSSILNKALVNYLSNDNPSTQDRLIVQAIYGFACAIMKNKISTTEDLDLLQPVFYQDLLRAYVVPYKMSQEIIKGTQTNHPVYIPFGLLLMLLNHSCSIYDSKKDFSDQRPLVYVDFNPNHNFCLSNKKQLSTNPWKVLIAAEGGPEDYIELFDEKVIQDKFYIKPTKDNKQKQPIFKSVSGDDTISGFILPFRYERNLSISNPSAYRGKIMHILLNIDYVTNLVKEFSTKDETNNVYLKPFLDTILDDINKYTGNFNIFRLSFNDTANTYQIVDDQLVPPPKEETISPKPQSNAAASLTLPLFGKNTIAKSLEIKTDVSTKLSNLIAISANSTIDSKSTLSRNGDNVGYINSFYVDRYIPNRTEISGSNTSKDLDTLITAASQFNSTLVDYYSSDTPSQDNVSQATNYYIEKMAKVKNKDFPTRASAMIPLSVNFTTDGISGLNMGQAFTLPPTLMPYTYNIRGVETQGLGKDYTNKVGFLVVGLNHSISDNVWNTSVKASMTFLKDIAEYSSSVSEAKKETRPETPPAVGSGEIKSSYPELPLVQIPPSTKLSYKDAKTKLASITDADTAKAVFAILFAEAAKSGDAFVSAGGYNYAGVQTDSGRWGDAGKVIAGRFERVDVSGRLREFAQFLNDDDFLRFMANRVKAKNFTAATGDLWTERYLNSWVYSNLQKQDPDKYNLVFPQKLAIFNSAISRYNKI